MLGLTHAPFLHAIEPLLRCTKA